MKKIGIFTLLVSFMALALISCNAAGDSDPVINEPPLSMNIGALRAVPMAADGSGTRPIVEDSFTHGGRNYFLIHAGRISNTYLSSIIPMTRYSGHGNLALSFTTVNEDTLSAATTETVNNSITKTDTRGQTTSVGASVEVRLGVVKTRAKVTATANHSWTRSSSETWAHSGSTSISLSEVQRYAETRTTALTLTPSDPIGYYRVAMYAVSDVYFFITTSIDNQELLDWETVVVASGQLAVRQEFSDNGIFDNAPHGNNLINFSDDFYRNLEVGARIFNFASYPPVRATTIIDGDVEVAIFIGQYDRGIIFNNYNIEIADRTTPLIIELDNFGMRSSREAIRSDSQTAIEINIRGDNHIIGGNGAAAGQHGHSAIVTNGSLTLTGSGQVSLHGGRGGNGSGGSGSGSVNGTANSRVGLAGYSGARGGDGGHGVVARSIAFLGYVGGVLLYGGDGGNGGSGGFGQGVSWWLVDPSLQTLVGGTGGEGGSGGRGGDGGAGIQVLDSVTFALLQRANFYAKGGLGGRGGNGGQGGAGARRFGIFQSSRGGFGGQGGDGGNGGTGGSGIHLDAIPQHLRFELPDAGHFAIHGGIGGRGGNGGTGGDASSDAQSGFGHLGAGGLGGNGNRGGHAVHAPGAPAAADLRELSHPGNGGARGSNGQNGSGTGAAPLVPTNTRTPQPVNGAAGLRVGS